MRSPRACWPYLAEKADRNVRRCQAAIAESRQRVAQLEASRQRVLTLYAEYRSQEGRLHDGGLGMAATMNQRQFMGQLLTLQQRVDLDLENARAGLARLQGELVAAQIELQKMQMLAEQDKAQYQRELQKREQRQLDDFGVMHFNLRRGV